MKTWSQSVLLILLSTRLLNAAEEAGGMDMRVFEALYNTPAPKRLAKMKAVIEQGADINKPIRFDRMLLVGESESARKGTAWPLDVAAERAEVDLLKLLLEHGAKLHGGELCRAALAERKDESLTMIKALLRAGANVNSRVDGFNALFWASFRGNKIGVKLLLDQPGVLLDEKSPDGDTPLLAAVDRGHTEIVELLLDAGANPTIANGRGQTAISLARRNVEKQEALLKEHRSILSRLESGKR